MRYIIGCKITNKLWLKNPSNPYIKDGVVDGIYAVNILPFILNKKTKDLENVFVYVYEDIEKAKSEVSSLSVAYRRDDVAFLPSRKSKYIRNFYLVKLDSPKCPIIIDESDYKEGPNGAYKRYKVKELR